MKNKVRHVLGISGGKDSAALAIYLFEKYPQLDIEYYTCDTGKELTETYQLIENLEAYLGKKIKRLVSAEESHEDPFDHFLKLYGGYLPSSVSRWCTRKLKLDPFEEWVGDDPVISYVGIRGDEDREGYISTKPNIQSIFPFRKNIWSEDVMTKLFTNSNIPKLIEWYKQTSSSKLDRILNLVQEPVTPKFLRATKVQALLDLDTEAFNEVVFQFLQTTAYPLSQIKQFPLIDNNDVLVRDDIFRILKDSGVGVPQYYEKISFEHNGQKGEYARSRSGCFFCFYQQKIEWIWLYEQHPELYKKAMEYEKDGYTWMQDESLADLIQPERMAGIKEDYIKKTNRLNDNKKSPYLVDILDEAEGEGCASCFI
ncbi:phosphoadenosine phosphosulfate reductase family protein [Sediminibacterium goheungense]|uniref:Phosphoadenosine phosphosulfate reductase family protein n=1 Tax=Sediminibacterium goheungense TaxID=1086393 RepID=A0A4R6J1U5_9BACT|nr:phosphoadenosine phosphosulfate reductase family protein [Sediminibacterium goheungense]TDO29229.1 phosphoadenosine phosphosulfate reductase family protein [Sediminibacterium goheungense]